MRSMGTVWLINVIALICTATPVSAQWYGHVQRGGRVFDAKSDNLSLLNHFDAPLPEAHRILYQRAESTLFERSAGGFADLAASESFQTFCRARDIRLLGGPLLGAVTQRGAAVWVRTVKPSEVSVILRTDGYEQVFGPVASSLESELSAVVHLQRIYL